MAAIGAAQQGHTIPNRTVYIGGVPPGTTYEDILNMVKFGPIESIKIVEDKNCCFIAFVEAAAASSFHTEFQGKRVLIGDNELKFGWGKPTICPQYIYNDVSNGASRNVYIGSIDETINEEILRAEFEPYGPIDQIRVLPEKHIAFVHLCSVAMAMKAVATLPTKPLFQGKRVNYGKDRCGNHLVGGNSGHTMQAGGGMMMGGGMGNMNMMSMASGMMGMGGGMMGGMGGAGGMTGGDANNVPIAPLRTLYLGGLHPDASSKDILDVVRGGLVQKLNLLPEKNTAFVTFVDPAAAHNLFTRGNDNGVVIKGKRVKVGWGKPAPTIPMFIFNGLQAGASRNVYVGPLTEGMDEERLRADFGVFGEIEYINILTEKNIAFVAFTDIGFAIRAVEGLKSQNAAYSACRVSYGKDRCNNPLRPPRQYADNVGAGAGVEDQQPTYYQ
ncbi:hypothetical protein BC830DRAFT_1065035 [Chytriomyces sp. MP71]|nr:hypothetical protein BC830DRAFT_1065035 [Chytriomyces sp. MP71]